MRSPVFTSDVQSSLAASLSTIVARDFEVRDMSKKEDETSENVRNASEMTGAVEAIDQPAENSSDFSRTSNAGSVVYERTYVRDLKRPDAITEHQKSSSSSADDLELSVMPDMVSRLNTLSDAGIDYSHLDVTDPNFDIYKWAKETLSKADKSRLKYRRASFAFIGLDVSGSTLGGRDTQATVASVIASPLSLRKHFNRGSHLGRNILSHFDGLMNHGEMLLVLGRPGSGCSTFLKTIAGELAGLKVSPCSYIAYNGNFGEIFLEKSTDLIIGVSQERMINQFKGEMVYNADVDHHFPHLTVSQTLEFAAALRTPSNRIIAASRQENINRLTAIVMAICKLSHTRNTKVGNDYVRGVSGGERKVSLGFVP